MNNISIDQNKEENLLLLFSQRILYERAKKFKYFTIFIGIVNFCLGVISNILLGDKYKDEISLLIFIFTLVSLELNKKSCESNKLAAVTQELIDRQLYGFETESIYLLDGKNKSEIISVAKDLRDKMLKKYYININNSGIDTFKGVKNWYTDIDSNLSINKAIMKCQAQNIYWDKYLIKYYKNILYIFAIIILIISLNLCWNKGVRYFVLGLTSSFSVLKIILDEIFKVNKYMEYSIEIDSIISTSNILDTLNIELLKHVQFKIFSRRISDFNIPTFIHRLNSIKLHKRYSRDN